MDYIHIGKIVATFGVKGEVGTGARAGEKVGL
jgi:ribosomal 30S subunit maturation factor RimM